jgi:hypothetical protein
MTSGQETDCASSIQCYISVGGARIAFGEWNVCGEYHTFGYQYDFETNLERTCNAVGRYLPVYAPSNAGTNDP